MLPLTFYRNTAPSPSSSGYLAKVFSIPVTASPNLSLFVQKKQTETIISKVFIYFAEKPSSPLMSRDGFNAAGWTARPDKYL